MNDFSMNQTTISVTNIERSFNFYKNFGLYPIVKSDHYARFIVKGNEATFSIHAADSVESTTTIYFEVTDVDKTFDVLLSKGYEFHEEPTDQSWLWREAYLYDPDKNLICIYHAGKNRMNPGWRLHESNDIHLLTEEVFEEWLNKYKHSWENGSPENAAKLFTNDAQYFETPFDEPAIGKNKIIEYWNAVPEGQSDIKFNYEIIKTFNNVGYCKWNASFVRKPSGKRVLLDGIFEITFDKDLRGKIFKEWWHRKEV